MCCHVLAFFSNARKRKIQSAKIRDDVAQYANGAGTLSPQSFAAPSATRRRVPRPVTVTPRLQNFPLCDASLLLAS